jgi:hypothetical protein
MRKHALLFAIAVSLVANTVNADGVTIAYWNFTTSADTIGGIPTVELGTPDLSIDSSYGSTLGSGGNSLNTVISGGDYLEADVFEGSSLLDFGTGDFSFSYWSFDDFGTDTGDGDARGPRIFDSLSGTTVGFQLGSNASGIYNFRMDDDAGGSVLSNAGGNLDSLSQPQDAWVHVSGTVDRSGLNLATIYFDGVSQGSYDISALTGNINPSQDMQIGVINGGGSAGTAQKSGLDDLAFYAGVLSASQIDDLRLGNTTPDAYVVPEPSSSALILLGGFGLLIRRRR